MDLGTFVPIIYLASSILFGVLLFSKNNKLPRLGLYCLYIGALVQTISLGLLFKEGKPIATSLASTLYLYSWLIVLVFLLSQFRYRAFFLGLFVAPLALIMTLPSLIIPEAMVEGDPSLGHPWIRSTHIILIFLGQALFTVAFIAGVIYLFQEKSIKAKHMGSFLKKLPSLTTLDNINHICLIIGFPLLTVGLALGFLYANEIWADQWKWGQRETWSLVTWFLYTVLIHGRLTSRWRGRKAAIGAILGFIIILFTFLISYIAPVVLESMRSV